MERENKENILKKSNEEKRHFLDLKKPIGWLFTYCGLILSVYGLLTGKDFYAKSLGININLLWGAVILVFGIVFLISAYAGKKLQD
ncbi:MAG: hypothetical protein JHC32_07720 [Candidatus Aminicenantes bacterium]|jgi:hypothetical protein|nr:hypothetical protein [Candidatus Aminicenantes bacterium]